MSILIIGGTLSSCALSMAADKPIIGDASPPAIEEQTLPIDWESAYADANSLEDDDLGTLPTSSTTMAVPLLLPPSSVSLSDTTPTVQPLAPAQFVTDRRGYSAMIKAATFTILIDASDQTFAISENLDTLAQQNFDSEYQLTSGGGQITIGRYGALYAVQLLCAVESQKNCITERMVREVIESLIVRLTQ